MTDTHDNTQHPFDLDMLGVDAEGIGTSMEDWASALSIWVLMQRRRVTVADAMLAFNATAALVLAGVEANYWMSTVGPADDALKLILDIDGE